MIAHQKHTAKLYDLKLGVHYSLLHVAMFEEPAGALADWENSAIFNIKNEYFSKKKNPNPTNSMMGPRDLNKSAIFESN